MRRVSKQEWENEHMHNPMTEGEALAVEVRDAFSDWLVSQMPPGTVIASPQWWAQRIIRQIEHLAAHTAASGGEVKWPARMVNLPCPEGTGDRIIGFRVPDGDPILGDYGLSEPLAWFRKVTIDRVAAPPSAVPADALSSKVAELRERGTRKSLNRQYRMGLLAVADELAALIPKGADHE